MLLKELQKLGFTKNLATVYTTLFDLGEAKAGNIVRSTGLHRNLVYLALEELEEKKTEEIVAEVVISEPEPELLQPSTQPVADLDTVRLAWRRSRWHARRCLMLLMKP